MLPILTGEYWSALWANNHWTIIFYSAMILLIVLLRKKIQWQTFGIGLYKTKIGLKLMEKLGTKYRGLVQILGLIGIGVGFIGMLFIVGNLLYALWLLVIKPSAPSAVGLVLPGVSLPGQAFTVPLISGWIALFLVIVIHEFSHGVVSRAYDVPVKSSGLLIFGPIGGAFVEPDEKKLVKQPGAVQYSLFAAGPFSNILSGLLVGLISLLVLTPIYLAISMPAGVEIVSVTQGAPASLAHLPSGAIVTSVDNIMIHDPDELSAAFDKIKPGDIAVLGTPQGSYAITTNSSPENSSRSYIGVGLKLHREPKHPSAMMVLAIKGLNGIFDFIGVFLLLSFGIGLMNLVPLGPVDGGRMFQLAARSIAADQKRGDWWWKKMTVFILFILIILVLSTFIKGIL